MSRRTLLLTLLPSVVWAASSTGAEPATTATAAQSGSPATVDFARQIRPLLHERCFACHGALRQEAGLRLDAVSLLLRGGDSGPAVTVRDPQASELLRRVGASDAAERMPPEGRPLTTEEIGLIRSWIEAGAPAPSDDRPEPDPREHWSFRPVVRPPLPATSDPSWSVNPIDRFIAAEHDRRGLRPARPASPETLLRRLYIDLIGLPPSAEEVAAFTSAPNPEQAYAEQVDRLLASPQYGERWARHWMDVWRYSDWYGRRSENDVRNSYPHIWRWRDWIVRSLNEDKPYDRMIVEMLAADEVSPEDDDAIVATGYLVRSFFSLHYDQWMRDVVDHTGKAFLGLRLGCALCHDHKYDPISQRDYFAFRAFFEPLEIRQDRVPGGPPLPKFVRYKPGSGASSKPIEAGLARVYDDRQTEPTYLYRGGDSRERFEGEPTVGPGVPAIFGGRLPPIEPVALSREAYYPGAKPWVRREAVDYYEREAKRLAAAWTAAQVAAESEPDSSPLAAAVQFAELEWRLNVARREATVAAVAADDARWSNAADADAKARHAARLNLLALADVERLAVAKQTEAVRLAAERAAADEKKKPALAKAETALADANKKFIAAEAAARKSSTDYPGITPEYHKQSTGRRRALAAWIASPENPLTARVAVNHLWSRHFGKPLAPTVYDLGRGGGEPTHRELLDWLAAELQERGEGSGGRGQKSEDERRANSSVLTPLPSPLTPSSSPLTPSAWSMKHLHRLIVTSRTYRLASVDESAAAVDAPLDASNRFYWRFDRRRMEAEALRDSLLSVSGLLDPTLGGPEIDNKQWATVMRRSLYFAQYPEAGGVMPFLEQFDAPSPDECYRRTESLVPQQALALENGELTQAAARKLGEQLWKAAAEAPPYARRNHLIDAAYAQILNRPPRPAERALCEKFLQAGSGSPSAEADLAAAVGLVRALFSHHDFITVP